MNTAAGRRWKRWALLAAWGEVPREIVEAYFLWLAREGLERDFNHVWDNLASAAVDIEALQVFPELRRAYDEGLIERGFMKPSTLDEVEAGRRGKWIERQRASYPPILDVAEATSWWQCYSEPDLKLTARQPSDLAREYANLRSRQRPKTGRNDPCPCGSNKKYKKCCGA